MNDLRIIVAVLLAGTLLITVACSPADQAEPASRAADLVFQGGNIYTVDARRSWAQAVAIKSGEIAFVGSDDGSEAYIGPDTKVVELKGRMMLPAFQDVHIHPISGGIEATRVNLNPLNTLDEYIAAIKEYAHANPDEPWILGGGWSMAVFGPGALASRKLIDELVTRFELGSEDLAQVYAFVGDRERTLQALETAFEERSGSRSVLSMKINPVYDFIRDEPQFVALLEKAGLSE